jgi:hypothetical protein
VEFVQICARKSVSSTTLNCGCESTYSIPSSHRSVFVLRFITDAREYHSAPKTPDRGVQTEAAFGYSDISCSGTWSETRQIAIENILNASSFFFLAHSVSGDTTSAMLDCSGAWDVCWCVQIELYHLMVALKDGVLVTGRAQGQVSTESLQDTACSSKSRQVFDMEQRNLTAYPCIQYG